jgi:hypothetical protein
MDDPDRANKSAEVRVVFFREYVVENSWALAIDIVEQFPSFVAA